MFKFAKKSSRVSLVVLVGLLVGVTLLASACAPAPQAVQAATNGSDSQTPTISVSGSGEASGTPDVAYVSLGIETQGGDLGQALTDSNTTMSAITDAMSGMGIEDKDLQTANFNVWMEQPRDDRGQPTGQPIYHVSNSLNVTVHDITKAGDVITAGLDAGANTVNGLSFGIEDTSALEAEARTKAIADAQDRAGQLADGLGVTLGAPISVSESFSGGGPVPVARDATLAEAASVPISTGQMSVTVTVNISFAIGQ